MSFDPSRLRRSDRIVGVSAIAFFIFLFFFKWYGGSATSSVGGISIGGSLNGWHSFTNSRWIWLLTIILALVAVARAAGAFEFETPVHLYVVVTALGSLSTLLILYRIIHHPSGGASFAGGSFSYGIKIGIWLGLIASAALTYGAYLGMKDAGTSLSDVRDQASAAMSSASKDTPPAPPAAGEAPAAPAPAAAPPPAAAPTPEQ